MGNLTHNWRRVFQGFAAAFLAAGVIWAVCHRLAPQEPTFQGKSLTFWLSQSQANWPLQGTPAGLEAEHAIRSIGTNALPLLLKWTAANDSPFKKRLIAWSRRQSLVKLRFHSDEEYHALADAGFASLGGLAKPAVPALIVLLKHTNSMVRVAAALDLMWIGPDAQDAVPALVGCLTDSDWLVAFRATRCLANINARPDLAVPALIRRLEQQAFPIQETIGALAAFGASAKPAVPQLVDLLKSGDLQTRGAASRALHVIDPVAWPKVSSDDQNPSRGTNPFTTLPEL